MNQIIISNPSFSELKYNLVDTSCVNHNTRLNSSNGHIRLDDYSTLSTFNVNNIMSVWHEFVLLNLNHLLIVITLTILGFDLTNIYQSRETSPRMIHNVDALLECKSHLTDMVSMVGCSWLILSSMVCLEEECQRI